MPITEEIFTERIREVNSDRTPVSPRTQNTSYLLRVNYEIIDVIFPVIRSRSIHRDDSAVSSSPYVCHLYACTCTRARTPTGKTQPSRVQSKLESRGKNRSRSLRSVILFFSWNTPRLCKVDAKRRDVRTPPIPGRSSTVFSKSVATRAHELPIVEHR